jgi:hypothetical protein
MPWRISETAENLPELSGIDPSRETEALTFASCSAMMPILPKKAESIASSSQDLHGTPARIAPHLPPLAAVGLFC